MTSDFKVSATGPILVAQYMQGQDSVESHSGDPSLAFGGAGRAVPQELRLRRLEDLRFELRQRDRAGRCGGVARRRCDRRDGVQAIGGSGYGVARVELSQAEVHEIDSSRAFGIVVYGYGLYTSYMYPGGLDLKRISPPPIF